MSTVDAELPQATTMRASASVYYYISNHTESGLNKVASKN